MQTPWGLQQIFRGSQIPASVNSFNIGNDEFQWVQESNSKATTAVEYALEYINTSYLWGGKTPFGIDWSALTQVIYRFFGFNLPRDASEQIDHGIEVEFDEQQAGDIAFFHNSAGKITHVGIIDANRNIIHASGHVRLDELKENGIYREDMDSITHELTSIKRLQ